MKNQVETLLQDLRQGARSLFKQPTFLIVAVITLALGVGANTAIFSVVHAVLLQSLPYRDADRLVSVWEHNRKSGNAQNVINMGNFFDCVQSRETPIADVESQHRSVSVCHLANIAIRLGRKLKWDPSAEQLLGDAEANTWLRREQRKGFEVT